MTMTRAGLIRILSEQVGLVQASSKEVVAVFFKAIITSLSSGQDVNLRNFGRFQTVQRKVRRSPQIPRRQGNQTLSIKTAVRFKPYKALKACVNHVGTELSGWPAEFEQIYDTLKDCERLKTILEDHKIWFATQGQMGKRATLAHCNLEGADLDGVDLREAKLARACLDRADLSNANLDNADLENAKLKLACLAGASLKGANLKGATLRGADLKEADLQDADLSGAELQYADLSGAELENAKFNNAQFFNTNLKNTLLDRKSPHFLNSLESRLCQILKPKRPVPEW